MKINSFSTNQFAGICDLSLSFSDGMNVLLGDNEAGKSTVISAIYHTLTKPVNLNKKSDFEFIGSAFPANNINTIDASVSFSENDEVFKLEKVWDKSKDEKSAKLKLGNGTLLRGNDEVESKLQSILRYGNAVYSNLIFGRQINEQNILEWCYDFFSEKTENGIDEARKTLSEAFSAADGISLEKIAGRIDEKLRELGSHWDFSRDCPVQKKDRWKKEVGLILEKYYELEDTENEYRNVQRDEMRIAEINRLISELTERKISLEHSRDTLVGQQSRISAKNITAKLLNEENLKLKNAENAVFSWADNAKNLEYAKKIGNIKAELSARTEKADIQRKIFSVEKIISELNEINTFISKYPDIFADFKEAENLSRHISELNIVINSIKLAANIILKNGHKAAVSSANGNIQNISENSTISANGFINISIPDIAEIQIAPEGIDIEKIQSDLSDTDGKINEIFRKYHAENIDSLRNILDEYNENLRRKTELEKSASEYDLEYLKKQAENIITDESIDIPENISDMENEFLIKSGMTSVEAAVGKYQALISGYISEYSDETNLQGIIEKLKNSISVHESELAEYSGIPLISEYEFNMELQNIRNQTGETERDIINLNSEKARLEDIESADSCELEDKIRTIKIQLADEKRNYAAYMQIKNDFELIRSQSDYKLNDFYNRFNEYLAFITDKKISMQCIDGKPVFTSGKNDITEKFMLSEGTKKTILLSFRLAVLSSFFADGNGFIVLDDDLLDMDGKRRIQAAELLKKFAEKNQVIFITCDNAIAELLGGNIVNIKR